MSSAFQRPCLALSHTNGRLVHQVLVAMPTSMSRLQKQTLTLRRCKSTTAFEAGEHKTGHISARQNESIFYFDNILPLSFVMPLRLSLKPQSRLANLIARLGSIGTSTTDLTTVVNRALPSNVPFRVVKVIPRPRERGAFVTFTCDSTTSPDIEATLKGHLKEHPVKPWFNPFQRVRAFSVRGKPWLEDLYRFPSSRLRVQFLPAKPGALAAELSQEDLYGQFRKYGKLTEIVSQPADSKVLPKYAILDFGRLRHAVVAKNCMHGFVVKDTEGGGKASTVLKLLYEPKIKAHWMRDWATSHPRIIIPLIAAIVAAVSVAIFDPIRTFFIEAHITRAFHLSDSKIWRWIRSRADYLPFRPKPEEPALEVIWDDRKADIEHIRAWLMETADTFIVVHGPRGSGQKELVLDEALENHRTHTLTIDCKPIQEANGDAATIRAAAREVGYRPVFSWMNSISSMFDLAAQATIGTKTGFSETLDSQLAKIWMSTATALKKLALSSRKHDDKDADLSDDEWLEAHPEKRPVVVIDNFLHKTNEGTVVYDKISEWAASLTTSSIAHVIFLTHDVSFSKSLSRALPDRMFRIIALGDCSRDVAKRFVINHLEADTDEANVDSVDEKQQQRQLGILQRREVLKELDECIDVLGGRLTDLEFLARRIKAGETPSRAIQEIITQSANEILKMYILDIPATSGSRPWTPHQAWHLIKQLAATPTLRYNELLLCDLFKSRGSGSAADTLQALEQAELITIQSTNGRPTAIKVGKPVYTAAFGALANDAGLRARLDLESLLQLVSIETTDMRAWEEELRTLAKLQKLPSELAPRSRWLATKIGAAQSRIEAYEKNIVSLKSVLKQEF